MGNDQHKKSWIQKLTVLDKLVALVAIGYGIYLYSQLGVFNNGEFIQNPMSWIIGGTVSLLISIINLPDVFLRRMKKSMVVMK